MVRALPSLAFHVGNFGKVGVPFSVNSGDSWVEGMSCRSLVPFSETEAQAAIGVHVCVRDDTETVGLCAVLVPGWRLPPLGCRRPSRVPRSPGLVALWAPLAELCPPESRACSPQGTVDRVVSPESQACSPQGTVGRADPQSPRLAALTRSASGRLGEEAGTAGWWFGPQAPQRLCCCWESCWWDRTSLFLSFHLWSLSPVCWQPCSVGWQLPGVQSHPD